MLTQFTARGTEKQKAHNALAVRAFAVAPPGIEPGLS
jgi:hypothetical protein